MNRLRYACSIVTALIICVYMPLYSVLSHYYGTYQHQYAWTVSAAFLSGSTVGLSLFLLYVTSLLAIYYCSKDAIIESLVHNRASYTPSVQLRVTYVAIFCLNLGFVTLVNTCYVYVLLSYGETIIALMELFVALFKVVWTNYVLSYLMQLAQARFGSKSDDAQKVQSYHHLHLLTIMSIMNNILQPCFATILVDPNCFYNAMFSPKYITSSFSTDTLVVANGFYVPIYSYSTYLPSFSYSYQCSSIVVTSFATILMYTALFVIILPPLFDYIKIKLRIKGSLISGIIAAITSNGTFVSNRNSDGTIVIDSSYIERSLLSIVGSVSVLLTFGVVQPLLGFVMFVSIASQSVYREYRLGVYISALLKCKTPQGCADADLESSKANFTAKILELDHDLQELSHSMLRSLWQVLLFAGFFYGFFVFDIIGDSVGYQRALWAPIAMILLCKITYSTPYFMRRYIDATRLLARRALGAKVSFRNRYDPSESHTDEVASVEMTTLPANGDTLNPINSPFN